MPPFRFPAAECPLAAAYRSRPRSRPAWLSLLLPLSFLLPAVAAARLRTGGTRQLRTLHAAKSERTANRGAPRSRVETALIPYWVADSLARVGRSDAPGSVREASLAAARNEDEGFQIAIRANSDADLIGLDARPTDLQGPGGALIPAASVTPHWEFFVPVSVPSPGSPYPPREWADALIPFAHPETGAQLHGGRLNSDALVVPRGNVLPLYVEVHVPPDAPPGEYRGYVFLSARGMMTTAVPVAVRVRSFALPPVPTLRSAVTPYGETYNVARFFGVRNDSPTGRTIAGRFNRFLLRHRLSPSTPLGTVPAIDFSTGHIDPGESHPVLQQYLDELGATSWAVPFGAGWPWPDPLGEHRPMAEVYLREVADYLAAHGWLERAFVYLADEPHSAEKYAQTRELAALVHSAAPGLPVLVTGQLVPEKAEWESLWDLVDIWVSLSSRFQTASMDFASRLGRSHWMYTEGASAPAWLIDHPLLNERVSPWLAWHRGQTGILYWTPWYWEEVNPWDTAATYVTPWGTYNGNGCLVYPGGDVGYAMGPIASLRLKALRDGIEDFEYLALLQAAGAEGLAAAEAEAIVESWESGIFDPDTLLRARERIADAIERALVAR